MSSLTESRVRHCLNCEAALSGRYCATCGQDHRHGRLAFGSLTRESVRVILELEGPFLNTLASLALRPARVVKDYWAGRRRCYVNPFKYCFLMGALIVIVIQLLVPEELLRESVILPEWVEPEFQDQMLSVQIWFSRYLNLFFLFTLPIQAVLLRALYFWLPLRVIEHYVALLFMYGQVYLYQAICNCAFHAFPESATVQNVALITGRVTPFIFFAWMAVGIYAKRVPARSWLARSGYTLGVIFLSALAQVVFGLLVSALLFWGPLLYLRLTQ